MKKIITASILAIVMSIISVSTASALSDKKIKKYVADKTVVIMKGYGLTDMIKKTVNVQIIAHTQDESRGIHWVAANTTFQSKEWGRYAVVIYVVLLDGPTLEQYESRGTSAALEHGKFDKYKAAFVNYKMLAEDRGDFLERVITQDDRNKANAQIDQLLTQS